MLHNVPHRTYTNYKWYMSSVLPSQKAVGNRFSYLTGSTQTTIEPCPLHFLTIRQSVTDSSTSQDIELLQVGSTYVIPHRSNPRQGQVFAILDITLNTLTSINKTSIFLFFPRIDQN